MRLTIVHPCIGRKPGQKYIRTWQMESLPAATLAGLTPKDVEVRFHDDRMEQIPFDEPADLVAISVETYTAKRAYQRSGWRAMLKRASPLALAVFAPGPLIKSPKSWSVINGQPSGQTPS
jgi:hypothetical protein